MKFAQPILPIIILQAGRLQIFAYQTLADFNAKIEPKEYFWQDSVARCAYGPFLTITATMLHYTEVVKSQQANETGKGKMIYVDFRHKQRLTYQEISLEKV